MSDQDEARRIAVKNEVERLKLQLLHLQTTLSEKRPRERRNDNHDQAKWAAYHNAKRQVVVVTEQLNKAKAELRELSGDGVKRPQWDMVREAWRILTDLDEAGVDIGERGQALLERIEFHVPTQQLQEHK